jgi:hypothetical protein
LLLDGHVFAALGVDANCHATVLSSGWVEFGRCT